MFEIILFSLFSNLMFYSYGYLIRYKNFTSKIEYINDTSIIGCIILAFIAVLINFFSPLNKEINTLVLFIGLVFLIYKKKKNLKLKEIYFFVLSTIITSLLIIYSNVYRPDAGLYHLPYVSFLNENKVIFGLSNIHFRFGTISIMQYLSAINNNFILGDNGIVLPLASIVSFFLIYFFNNVIKIVKNVDTISLENLFSLFIIIFISYKINRYSSYGNDAVAHLSYFYLISKILSKKKINISFISLISVFIFLNKATMIVALFIPLVFFIKEFKFENLKIIYSFAGFFFIFWIIKNIIISGCVVYPVEKFCITKLNWTDLEEIKYQNISGEAWSKDWPNRADKKIIMEEYNKNFNWLASWSKNHGLFIIKIILPYVFVVVFIYFFLIKKKSKSKIIFERNKNAKYLFTVSLIGLILFFLKFPLYRYGYSFLITSLLLIPFLFRLELNKKKLNVVAKVTFIICLFVISGKQFLRYTKNINSEYIWPRIYSFTDNLKINSKKITFEYGLNIFKSDELCMYSVSPCTNYELKDNLNILKKNNYYFINLKNN